MASAHSDTSNNVDQGSGDPVHRVQVKALTSKDEVQNYTPMQVASLVNAVERQFAVLSIEDKQERRIRELEARVEHLEKERIRMEEEIQQEEEQSKRVEAFMNCAICMEAVQDPQLLNCGHSACYPCLWNWWKELYFEVEDPIVDENQDPDEPGPFELIPNNGWDDPNPTSVDFVIPPMPRLCPYCQTTILFRPAPNYILDNMVKIMRCHKPEDDASSDGEIPSVPKKEYMWHGIFGQSAKGAEILAAIKNELDERLPRYHREVLELGKSMAEMGRTIPIDESGMRL